MTLPLDFREAFSIDMERKGLSTAAVGRGLGISQQAVHGWMKRGFPPIARLDALLEFMGPDSELAKLGASAVFERRAPSRVSQAAVPARLPSKPLKSNQVLLDLARDRWTREQAVFAQALPPSRQAFVALPAPRDSSDLTPDYASPSVLAALVCVEHNAASHNFSAKLLQLITYEQLKAKPLAKLLLVCTHAPSFQVSERVAMAAEAYGVKVLVVPSGREAAARVELAEQAAPLALID